MKINPLQIAGALALLVCLVFALANLDQADRWVFGWLPFVAAGIGLVLVGTIVAGKTRP